MALFCLTEHVTSAPVTGVSVQCYLGGMYINQVQETLVKKAGGGDLRPKVSV